MRIRSLFIIMCLLLFKTSYSQMTGGNVFLQGHWLEIGELNNGAFGTCTSPAGYHSHPSCCSGTMGTGGALAETYDYGHDGWTVGAQPAMGDYTYPGSPFEGWALQIGTGRNTAFQGCPGNYVAGGGGIGLTGSIASYSNVGGRVISNWAGTALGGTLQIKQETRVDTNASWVVVTTKFYNTAATPTDTIFYIRSCDPDNDETWTGGSFTTNNQIDYQNDADHRVQVTATGQLTSGGGAHSPLSLCTKDCRAVAFIYTLWPFSTTTNFANFWYQNASTSGTSWYAPHANHTGDIGIGIVFKLGRIAAGDSNVISYAYTFNGINGIDSAFPEPTLVVNGVSAPPSGIAPAPTYDTFDVCGTGIVNLPVTLDFSNDKSWTWSSWTWYPGTGLTTTTGVTNTIHVTSLPPIITYTIVGTDSLTCGQRVMYLTIKTCNGATVNSPCIGDPLYFNAPGDSTGATYIWYGPAPSTTTVATTQSFTMTPSTWSDTGTYHVVKTVAGASDTSFCVVVIHPLPVLNLASSIPLCGTPADTLRLSVTPDSVGETFSWSGPGGFTSTSPFPLIDPFDSSKEGTYTVHATTAYGCQNTASIDVYQGIVPGFYYTVDRGCSGDVVAFVDTAYNATTYSWNFGDGSGAVTTRDAVHTYPRAYDPSGIWTVTVNYTNAHCTNSATLQVDTRHTVKADFTPTPDTFCAANPVQSTTMTDNSTATVDTAVNVTVPGEISTWAWDFGDGTTDNTSGPSHTYAQAGVYQITLVVTDSIGCRDTTKRNVVALRVDIDAWSDTTLCLRQPLILQNHVRLFPNVSDAFTYSWTESSPNLNDLTIKEPSLTGFGIFTDVFTATINPWGCYQDHTYTIHSVLGALLTNVTPSTVIPYGTSIQLNSDNELYYHWVPNDGSVDNPNINNPIATPLETTVYTVYGMDQYGCVDSAFITITVDSTLNEAIPSAFTPNGDGLNDVFRPVGISYQKLVEFRVYNRWGQQIFYSNDIKNGWDGTWNGVPQDMGVYHYQVIVAKPGGPDQEGRTTVYKGDVTLIR